MAILDQDKYTNINQDVAGFDNLSKFDVFLQNNRYLDPMISGYSFIFVTKPMLFLYPYKPASSASNIEKLAYENMTQDPVFSQFLVTEVMNNNDKFLIEQLSYYKGMYPSQYLRSNFLPIFTNRVQSFPTLDITLAQNDNFETRHGFRMPLPTHKNESIGSGSLSIMCQETANLDFMKMMTLWVNYITNITDGTFHANPTMVKNGVLDYAVAIYYFVLEPDGRTLKYWSKYTGCWPTSIPQANLSFNRGQQTAVESEIQFVYSSKEDMDPSILEDFNRVSLNFFEKVMIDVQDDDFSSVRKSPLLSKDGIKTGNKNYIKDIRGPLVFYKNSGMETSGNSTELLSKFELTFGIDTFKNSFISNKLDQNDYLFNPEEFFSSKLDE